MVAAGARAVARVVSDIPGRMRVSCEPRHDASAALSALCGRLAALPGVTVRQVPHAASVVAEYDPAGTQRAAVLACVDRMIATLQAPAPSRAQKPSRPLQFIGAPGLAVALAAAEAAPPLLVIGALAYAGIPVARRAFAAAREKRLATEHFDIYNLIALASGGAYLTGGLITLLLGLQQYTRAVTARCQLDAAAQTGDVGLSPSARTKAAATLARRIDELPVGDTAWQRRAPRTEGVAAVPLLGAAAAAALLSGNIARLTDSARAVLDIQNGIEFSVQAAARTAMIAAARHGVLVLRGQALEQLAAVDTVILIDSGARRSDERDLIRSLQAMGLQVVRARSSEGKPRTRGGLQPSVQAAVERLRARKRTPVVVGPAEAMCTGAARMLTGASPDTAPDDAEALLLDPELLGLGAALVACRSAERTMRQNVGLVAVPIAASLAAILTERMTTPVPSAVKAASILATSWNSVRPLSRARKTARQANTQRVLAP